MPRPTPSPSASPPAAPTPSAPPKSLLNRLDGSMDSEIVKRGADLSAKVVAMGERTKAALRAKMGTPRS